MTHPDWRRQMPLAGPFQQLVLAALIRLGPDVDVPSLRRHIREHSGRKFHPQQLYEALVRLEARGYARSLRRAPMHRARPWWNRPGPFRPGRLRVFSSITVLGRRALRVSTAPVDALRHGLPGLGHDDRPWRNPTWPSMPEPGHDVRGDARREHRRRRMWQRRPPVRAAPRRFSRRQPS
jgi:PadR family transcriptional regulator, regulatory protein PadR